MQAAFVTNPVVPWRVPDEVPVLGCDEIHVWRTALDRTQAQILRFRHFLAGDERSRADRFHFEKDRGHFIVARGVLRAILGSYLKLAPESVCFGYGSNGKPALAGDRGDDSAIKFNVSHSHGVALYAVARRREVGIDVERIRSDLAVAEIAERFFAPGEVMQIRSLPAEAQWQAFFRLWTRKEAYVKARGEGLSLPLDQFDLSAPPPGTGATPIPQRKPSETTAWAFCDLEPASGYLGALAAETHGWRLACFQWPEQTERLYQPTEIVTRARDSQMSVDVIMGWPAPL
jgi:4'-phosphopantetheinyl transferase